VLHVDATDDDDPAVARIRDKYGARAGLLARVRCDRASNAMGPMRTRAARRLSLLLGMAAACSSPAPEKPAETAVVVGLESESLIGAIDTVRVVTTLGGATNTDATFPIGALPLEVRVVPPEGRMSAPIGVHIEGYLGAAGAAPLLVRTAEATFVPGHTMLLRILLQGQCLLALPGGPPGAPACSAPQTCIAGVCQDDHVSALEAHSSDWAVNTPDICKPANAGAPVVQVGTGQSDYLPLSNGDTVQAEQGPQGGHHVWVAVRQQNLKQAGSTTTITSVQPSTGLAGPRTAVVFTFDPDQGGFCKLAGLRYQLDADGTDYHQFLGAPLDITVVITDAAGARGTGVAHVNVAPTILCASGLSGCQ
jgi:hypothetical protein